MSAFQRDPIAVCRDVVRIIRSSGQRREAFEELREQGNIKGWWGYTVDSEGKKHPKVKERLQLLCDVRTRWDSLYYMIQRARINRGVSALLPHHNSYLLFFR